MKLGRAFVRDRGAACVALIGACMLAGGAVAQEQPEAPLPEVVAALGSADVRARESAMGELATADRFSFADIESALQRADLSSEQRYRLLEAAKERFMTSPRAAMGVQFVQPQYLPDRVVIGNTFPQFPSSRVLEPGDMFLEVEGVPLRSRNAQLTLGGHIIAHDPGDKLHVVIRRGEKKLTFDVELGRFADLPSSQMQAGRLALAWEVRSKPLLGPTIGQPIECGLGAGQWDAENVPGRLTPEELRKIRLKAQLPIYRPVLTAGGQPRGGAVDLEEPNVFSAQQGRFNAAIDPRVWQQQLDVARFPDAPALTPDEEIARLESGLRQYQQQLAARAMPPAGGAAQRQDLLAGEAERQRLSEMIAMLQRQLVAVRAEAAENPAEKGSAPAPAVDTAPGAAVRP